MQELLAAIYANIRRQLFATRERKEPRCSEKWEGETTNAGATIESPVLNIPVACHAPAMGSIVSVTFPLLVEAILNGISVTSNLDSSN